MKKGLAVLLLLAAVKSVFAIGATTWKGYSAEPVEWSNVDSVLISGADTTISDTFLIARMSHLKFEYSAIQASDSIAIDSITLETTLSEKDGGRFIFKRRFDVNNSIAYGKIVGSVTSPCTTDVLPTKLPISCWGRVIIYTGSDTGTNMRVFINKTQGF